VFAAGESSSHRVRDEPQLFHGGQDFVAGGWSNRGKGIESTTHGGRRHARARRHVVNRWWRIDHQAPLICPLQRCDVTAYSVVTGFTVHVVTDHVKPAPRAFL
jgi:hypothetical protein